MIKSILVTIVGVFISGTLSIVLIRFFPKFFADQIMLVGIFLVTISTLFLIFRKQINKEVEEYNSKSSSGIFQYQKVPRIQMIIFAAIGIMIIVYSLISELIIK